MIIANSSHSYLGESTNLLFVHDASVDSRGSGAEQKDPANKTPDASELCVTILLAWSQSNETPSATDET